MHLAPGFGNDVALPRKQQVCERGAPKIDDDVPARCNAVGPKPQPMEAPTHFLQDDKPLQARCVAEQRCRRRASRDCDAGVRICVGKVCQ